MLQLWSGEGRFGGVCRREQRGGRRGREWEEGESIRVGQET